MAGRLSVEPVNYDGTHMFDKIDRDVLRYKIQAALPLVNPLPLYMAYLASLTASTGSFRKLACANPTNPFKSPLLADRSHN